MIDLLVLILVGALAGWAAGHVMKGKGFGLWGNIAVGVGGALLGGFLFGVLGAFLVKLLVALVGAMVLLWLIDRFKKKNKTV